MLKWTSFTLLAYVATALVVDVPWRLVAYNSFVPNFSLRTDYIVAIVAVLGTTITPYCFFWQSSQEAEDERVDPAAHTLIEAPEQAPTEITRMRIDTYFGMGYSNAISLFIIVTTAATLNAHGITDIQTSAQAAEALRPIAGAFAFAVFAAGIIGIGLLAVPVLAGSCAYALGEALGWTVGSGAGRWTHAPSTVRSPWPRSSASASTSWGSTRSRRCSGQPCSMAWWRCR